MRIFLSINWRVAVLALAASFSLQLANGAPIPATSSSPLISGENGIYHSKVGFKMSAEGTKWELSALPAGSKYLLSLYRSPEFYNNVQASLSVRIDQLQHPLELNAYVKKWVRQYPRFGFEVLGTKGFSSGDKLGYVIDLINKENEKQLRQVVFMREKSAIVMTCRDHIDNFKKSLKDCNQIIRSFEWTADESQPPQLTE